MDTRQQKDKIYVNVEPFLKENTARATEAPNMVNTNKSLRINPVARDKTTVQTEP